MDDKQLLGKLDEISQRFGKNDKEIEFSNLATKVHGLLANKCGKLSPLEQRALRKIGEEVEALGRGKDKVEKPLKPKRPGPNQRSCGGRVF